MTGQHATRVMAAVAVLAVTAVAGISSFGHIEDLALRSGQSITLSRLSPLSVDGLIVASSMALLSGHRSAAARSGLITGIAATLGANIASGASHGVMGAAVSAWPAVAFILSTEVVLGMLRPGRDVSPASDTAETVSQPPVQAVEDAGAVSVPDAAPDAAPGLPERPTAPRRQPRRQPSKPSRKRRAQPVPAEVFRAELDAGEVPSIRKIQKEVKIGFGKAKAVQEELKELVSAA